MPSISSITDHIALLDAYVADLGRVRDLALRRQEGRLSTWTQRLKSEARAREKLAIDAPPCSDLEVVAIIRQYWLACDSLNRKLGREVVAPREFMIGWLQSRSPELVDFLRDLPYWPIGVDNEEPVFARSTPASWSHAKLFEAYVQELRQAIDEAQMDQRRAIQIAIRAGLSRQDAENKVANDHGKLCTDPRIITVFRRYFLACDRLNREGRPNENIPPNVFATEMLMGKHDDLFNVIIDLPYSPVGLDASERYV
jgi:hypothetical protein